jgi:hypothetical protein
MEIPWVDVRPVAASQQLGFSTTNLGKKPILTAAADVGCH